MNSYDIIANAVREYWKENYPTDLVAFFIKSKKFTKKYGESNKKVKNIKLPYTLKNSHPSAEKLSMAEENIKNGKFKPVVLSADDYIVDGYTRYLAAKKLGIMSIPVSHVGWKVSKNGGKLPPRKT